MPFSYLLRWLLVTLLISVLLVESSQLRWPKQSTGTGFANKIKKSLSWDRIVRSDDDLHAFSTAKRELTTRSNWKSLLQTQRIVPKLNALISSPVTKMRVLMLFFYATLGSCMPFLSFFYRSKGLSEVFMGYIGAVTPAVNFIISPLWGALADRTGFHKSIMIATFVSSIFTRCLMSVDLLTSRKRLLFLLVGVTAALNAPVKPLMDSAILSDIADKADYGKSRLFGQLGFGLSSALIGPFLLSDVKNIFRGHVLFAVPTLLLMLLFTPEFKEPKPDTVLPKPVKKLAHDTPGVEEDKIDDEELLEFMRDLEAESDGNKPRSAIREMFDDRDMLVFFVAIFLIGLSSGIIENFCVLRMHQVGGTGKDLGLCRMVSAIAGGPMFWMSGAVVRLLGVHGVLIASFLAYGTRFLNYAWMREPMHALPAEALRGITFASFWAAATMYVYTNSPTGTTATMLGLLNGMYGGLGQSMGALLGGYLSKKMGISKGFLLCASIEVGLCLIYTLYNFKMYRRKRFVRRGGAGVGFKLY
jgi:MFS family permease